MLQSRPGCKCPPGYTGSHCELLDTHLHQDGPPLEQTSTGSAAIIFFFLVFATLIVVLSGVIILRYRRGKDWNIESAHLTEGAGQSSRMEEVDFNGEDVGAMEDVELL
jgi:hypothetical protein